MRFAHSLALPYRGRYRATIDSVPVAHTAEEYEVIGSNFVDVFSRRHAFVDLQFFIRRIGLVWSSGDLFQQSLNLKDRPAASEAILSRDLSS